MEKQGMTGIAQIRTSIKVLPSAIFTANLRLSFRETITLLLAPVTRNIWAHFGLTSEVNTVMSSSPIF
jgi:hypothetical protein